jgi:hypothetical protein
MGLLGAMLYDECPMWLHDLVNLNKNKLPVCIPWNSNNSVDIINKNKGEKLYLGVGVSRGQKWKSWDINHNNGSDTSGLNFPIIMFEMTIIAGALDQYGNISQQPSAFSSYFWDVRVLQKISTNPPYCFGSDGNGGLYFFSPSLASCHPLLSHNIL